MTLSVIKLYLILLANFNPNNFSRKIQHDLSLGVRNVIQRGEIQKGAQASFLTYFTKNFSRFPQKYHKSNFDFFLRQKRNLQLSIDIIITYEYFFISRCGTCKNKISKFKEKTYPERCFEFRLSIFLLFKKLFLLMIFFIQHRFR